MTKRPDWKKPAVHSTPQEMAMGRSPRPPRRNFQQYQSLISEDSSEDPMSQLPGFSPISTFRKRLSTVQDLESSHEQVEPHPDHLAAEEEPCMSALLNKEDHQKTESLKAMSWPRNLGIPGISDTTWQRRRDPKKRAAAVGFLPPNPALSPGSSGSCVIPRCHVWGICSSPKLGGVHRCTQYPPLHMRS